MKSNEDNATAWHHRPNRLCAHRRCTNHIDHTIPAAGVALLHEGDHILLACVDYITRTPALCNLYALWCYIADDDLLDTQSACRGDSAKPDGTSSKDQKALSWLDPGESDGMDGTCQRLRQRPCD
jgi:hypothetical protein